MAEQLGGAEGVAGLDLQATSKRSGKGCVSGETITGRVNRGPRPAANRHPPRGEGKDKERDGGGGKEHRGQEMSAAA